MIDIKKELLNNILNYINTFEPKTIEGLIHKLAYANKLKDEGVTFKNIDIIIKDIEDKLLKLGIKL